MILQLNYIRSYNKLKLIFTLVLDAQNVKICIQIHSHIYLVVIVSVKNVRVLDAKNVIEILHTLETIV